jgi:hypothetical protein
MSIRRTPITRLFRRGEGYGFGSHNPSSNWHKWRESELLKGTPPLHQIRPDYSATPITAFGPVFVTCFIIGSGVSLFCKIIFH